MGPRLREDDGGGSAVPVVYANNGGGSAVPVVYANSDGGGYSSAN